MEEDSFSEYNSNGSSLYDSDEVHSQPINFSHTFYFLFGYQDPIGTWLDKYFMERYPLHSILHILYYVNGMSDDLILSIFDGFVIQLGWLIFDTYILVGWSYMHGYTRNMIKLSIDVARVV